MSIDQNTDVALREAELRKAKAVADFFQLVRIPTFVALCLFLGALPFLIWNAL